MSGDLLPGFTRGKGPAVFLGALRRTPKSDPFWTCSHIHSLPAIARRCAEAEADRRQAGREQVFSLLHCGVCTAWYPDEPTGFRCFRCGVPMERVKLAVLERLPLGQAGNRSS